MKNLYLETHKWHANKYKNNINNILILGVGKEIEYVLSKNINSNIYVIDIDKNRIDQYIKLYSNISNIIFINSDIINFRFKDNINFDLILANFFFEHLGNKSKDILIYLHSILYINGQIHFSIWGVLADCVKNNKIIKKRNQIYRFLLDSKLFKIIDSNIIFNEISKNDTLYLISNFFKYNKESDNVYSSILFILKKLEG